MNKEEKKELHIPEELPLLPVRDVVIFPYMILPLFVGREKSIAAVDAALARDRLIFLAAQKELAEEEPEPQDIYATGTVAMIMRMLKLPDGRVKILVQGLAKARLVDFVAQDPYFAARVERLVEPQPAEVPLEVEALMRTVRDQLSQLLNLGKAMPPEVMVVVENIEDPGSLADLVASNIGLKVSEAQALIEILEPLERLRRVKDLLAKELELMTVQNRIQSQAKEEMGKSQREYFLREQLRAIQAELGEADPRAEEVAELRGKLEKAGLPKEALAEAEKQLRRLETMHPEAAEYAMIRTYLDWLVELPWSKATRDNLDIEEGAEGPRRGPLRSGEDQGAHPRVSRRAQAEEGSSRARCSASSAPPGSARPASANRSPAPWDANSCASPWAGCATRRRSAATAAPTSAPCRGASFRG